MDDLEELFDHLASTSRLNRQEAERVVHDVLSFLSETPETYVVRRHVELQSARLTNPVIFECIARELEARRFSAPALTVRQIRRIIYG